MSNQLTYLFKQKFTDLLRSKKASLVLSLGFYLFFCLTPKFTRRIQFLLLAHRTYPYQFIENSVTKRLDIINANFGELMISDNVITDRTSRNRAIILKTPEIDAEGICIEKGVYLIEFTTSFQYYLAKTNLESLEKYFHIVLEPSWSGYCLPEIIAWTRLKNPVVVQASEKRDFKFLTSLKQNFHPVTFGASDWVDHRIFHPIENTEKKYDAVYVTNYMGIKRNHIFLKAISKIGIPNYKAALVCGGWGPTKGNLIKLIKKYGLTEKVTLFEKLPQDELNKVLNQSKVNVLLSLKEGSNRSLFEGMFANTPGIVLMDNIGVNKSYFVKETGAAILEKDLTSTLEHFHVNYSDYSPRKWCMENISVSVTNEKLEAALKGIATISNQQWTRGTFVKSNSPESNYVDEDIGNGIPSVNDVLDALEEEESEIKIALKLKRLFNDFR